ncbi:hypothetical protein GJAV_G00105510 [Gymnothorax javanicus]|nr:hypothetical protein GJAV_G00105510 [Gymnothorax javanicus]
MRSIDRDGNVVPPSRTFKILLTLSLLAAGYLCTPLMKLDPLVYHEQLLWVQGGAGQVHTYRIPLITSTPRGSLLAFAEARKGSAMDMGAKFIALRRSTDRGATWSPTSFIVDDGALLDGLNLGAVVVDEQKGAIILLYSICFYRYHCSPSCTMMVQSLDDGVTWSPPRNLSTQLGVKSFIPGPGYGIQPVEMEDGRVVINARNQNFYHCRCRIVVNSTDGGETLPVENLRFDSTLIDPAVAAGALQKGGVMFFTNPADAHSRVNLTLRWSLTNGVSWENEQVLIYRGPSGYSCMTSMMGDSAEDNKYIYVLYEKGRKTSVDMVSFAKIHLYGGR